MHHRTLSRHYEHLGANMFAVVNSPAATIVLLHHITDNKRRDHNLGNDGAQTVGHLIHILRDSLVNIVILHRPSLLAVDGRALSIVTSTVEHIQPIEGYVVEVMLWK